MAGTPPRKPVRRKANRSTRPAARRARAARPGLTAGLKKRVKHLSQAAGSRLKRVLTSGATATRTRVKRVVTGAGSRGTVSKATRAGGSGTGKTGRRPGRSGRTPAQIPLGRRVVVFVVAAAALMVVIGAALGDRGWLEVRRRGSQQDHLAAEVAQLEADNAALAAEISALKSDPYVIEKLAREKLGYARPGEAIFLFPEDQTGGEAVE